MRKLNQNGFIPMLIAILVILVVTIAFVFIRVMHANH
jgi:hypothetical protein